MSARRECKVWGDQTASSSRIGCWTAGLCNGCRSSVNEGGGRCRERSIGDESAEEKGDHSGISEDDLRVPEHAISLSTLIAYPITEM